MASTDSVNFRQALSNWYCSILCFPNQSGDEILKKICKSSNVSVIIISAKDLPHTKIDLLPLGVDDYITKPFDFEEVATRVLSNLRRS